MSLMSMQGVSIRHGSFPALSNVDFAIEQGEIVTVVGPNGSGKSTLLRALIGAAKADGHIDDRERELIDAEVAKLTNDPQTLQWFDAELRKPLDPAEVASAAQTPEMAAEMYLASLLVVDEQSFMEKAYLQELSSQLKLDPQLIAELDHQVQQV